MIFCCPRIPPRSLTRWICMSCRTDTLSPAVSAVRSTISPKDTSKEGRVTRNTTNTRCNTPRTTRHNSSIPRTRRGDSAAQHSSIQNGESPNHKARWNRDWVAGVTNPNIVLPYAASPIISSSSSSGSNVDSRKARKRYTDSLRSKALINAKHRFETLFPVSTLLEAGETVVRVCK
ncbi:hypothetical protein BDN71DRAFT_377531 [Pleurotus eryngii]|uniref:Uncharacterized protein n=1 Tax=Pleurotus eryngii TaxID=5323 RepID=A0A9P6A2I4_PLEER|nr:hypothetical protein BDN71DRAFT_377531 [Pleurotus eryngii]